MQKRVLENSGVELVPEILFLGNGMQRKLPRGRYLWRPLGEHEVSLASSTAVMAVIDRDGV